MRALHPLLLVACTVALAARPAAAQVVRGTLKDEATGGPIAGAAVSLLNAAGRDRAATVTDAAGAFQLRAPGQGVYWLRLTPAGFQPVESRPFAITRADTLDVPLTTRSQVTTLEGVTVRATTAQNLNFAGFLSREQNAFGRFAGPDAVKRQMVGSVAASLAALLPGVDYSGRNVILRSRGRRCAPVVLLDGARYLAPVDEIPGAQIRAVEVYDQPTLIPPELALTPFNNCGLIALWTYYALGID
jgi:hypothetical protein